MKQKHKMSASSIIRLLFTTHGEVSAILCIMRCFAELYEHCEQTAKSILILLNTVVAISHLLGIAVPWHGQKTTFTFVHGQRGHFAISTPELIGEYITSTIQNRENSTLMARQPDIRAEVSTWIIPRQNEWIITQHRKGSLMRLVTYVVATRSDLELPL